MTVDWEKLKIHLRPIPNYEDLARRLRDSLAYPLVSENYNFSMSQAAEYTRALLGGDTRQRYQEHTRQIITALRRLKSAGVKDIIHLVGETSRRELLQDFTVQYQMAAEDVVDVLRYLIYWVLPEKRYLSELAKGRPDELERVLCLRENGIRFTLDLLEKGRTPREREALAAQTGLPEETISMLTHQSDMMRMPYTRAASAQSYYHAGYRSLESLAKADISELDSAMMTYGASIGKNLHHGMDFDNCIRIARIVPQIVEE